ncbi:hypothetical protein [Roseobacter weihaiensis]|uniref:hypothetical protein n=1 Tax=Roseobacter weihaiensis TaxID=2763262 RepID=UPI001D0B409B|nr:hypothetical protein [Roseobacter sp. H9]
MLDSLNRLDLTVKDIELIEAALHTQKKILSVQSEAGGTGSRQKLSDLTHLMKRIGRARPASDDMPAVTWSQMARGFFSLGGSCSQLR